MLWQREKIEMCDAEIKVSQETRSEWDCSELFYVPFHIIAFFYS